MSDPASLKARVREHWQAETCGVRYAGDASDPATVLEQTELARYALEPEIVEFAGFGAYGGKKVLEIGVGGGVDHLSWYRAGAIAYGIDLTQAGIDLTSKRLARHGFGVDASRLQRGDAEALAFPDNTFDLVYSWGVLHHTPDTPRAFSEACRVLKPGGELRALIYHHPSWVGLMLWLLHGPLKGRLRYGIRQAVYDHLESPGTKTYTVSEAKALVTAAGLVPTEVCSRLSVGDMLNVKLSSRYQSKAHRILYALYPRWLVRLAGDRLGLNLMIRATKPSS